jgi:catechol 2,3-dioxygenase-like lactoylglutathione lyase family enzyme
MVGSLTHVRLLVEAYARCFAFYEQDLGFETVFGDAESGYGEFETGDVTLALHDAAEVEDLTGGGSRGRDGAALILAVEDVDDAYAELADADCTRTNPPEDRPDWGIRVAHVRDPDGTLLELNEPLDDTQT